MRSATACRSKGCTCANSPSVAPFLRRPSGRSMELAPPPQRPADVFTVVIQSFHLWHCGIHDFKPSVNSSSAKDMWTSLLHRPFLCLPCSSLSLSVSSISFLLFFFLCWSPFLWKGLQTLLFLCNVHISLLASSRVRPGGATPPRGISRRFTPALRQARSIKSQYVQWLTYNKRNMKNIYEIQNVKMR